MSRIKLTAEEKEALYKAEIERKEREEPPKKALGIIKRKVKLTDAEKKELVAREIHRREQILKARAAKAKAENSSRKKGKLGVLVAAALLIVAGAFITLRDSSVQDPESVPVRSVESTSVEDVALPVESSAIEDSVTPVEESVAPAIVSEENPFDNIDESPVKLADADLGLSSTVPPTATPVPTSVPTPRPSSTPKPTPTPRPDVTLTVSKDYAFEGKTSYALSRQEYYDLMDRLRQHVADEVSQMTKTGGTEFPHFESVSVSKDCSVYTVVVNDANSRTPAELSAPDRFKEYAEMYAAFNKSKLTDASVEYVTMNGNLLSKVGLVATSTVLALSDNGIDSGSSVARTSPDEAAVPTPTVDPDSFITVYVSRKGIAHLKSDCSGMKYYTEMSWAEAKQLYRKCDHCW